jgi:LPXTG-motif cell wall-anchored protein
MDQYTQYTTAVGEQYGAVLPATGGFNLPLFLLSMLAIGFAFGIGAIARRYGRR